MTALSDSSAIPQVVDLLLQGHSIPQIIEFAHSRAVRCKLRTPGGDVRCHAGGLDAACSIAGVIASKISAYPFDRVTIVGHSLGGMIARILRLKLPGHYRHQVAGRPIHCVTFGAPRSGCRRFAAALNSADGYLQSYAIHVQ